jgi:hypothetical protein
LRRPDALTLTQTVAPVLPLSCPALKVNTRAWAVRDSAKAPLPTKKAKHNRNLFMDTSLFKQIQSQKYASHTGIPEFYPHRTAFSPSKLPFYLF